MLFFHEMHVQQLEFAREVVNERGKSLGAKQLGTGYHTYLFLGTVVNFVFRYFCMFSCFPNTPRLSLIFIINQIYGPGVLAIPIVYQQSGYIPTNTMMLIFFVASCFASTMVLNILVVFFVCLNLL